MKIPIDIVPNILEYLKIRDIGNMDIAFTNKSHRTVFLEKLQQQSTLFVENIMDKHSFIKWLQIRNINYRNLIFNNSTAYLLNSVICVQHKSIVSIVINGNINRDSVGIMSLLCTNVKSFKYNLKKLISDEDDDVDCFYDINVDFLKNLEYLYLNKCSNYVILLLTIHGKNLKYVKIDDVRNLNRGIVHDFIRLHHTKCKIECDLIWSVKTNLMLMSQKSEDEEINIEFDYEDINFYCKIRIQEMFKNHKVIKMMTISNVYDVSHCNTVFDSVSKIKTLVIGGINMMNLDLLLEFCDQKNIDILKIIYIPTIIENCITNLIKFFDQILLIEKQQKYIDILIDFRLHIINDDIVFDKFIELVVVMDKVINADKIYLLRINNKIIRKNTNWKNDIYYHFLF
jgi:hypothetical protein